MKFTLKHGDSHQKVTRHIAVEDGPVIPYPHSNAKKIQVDTVSIEFVSDGGPWEVRAWPDVHGNELKKDGTHSKNRRSAYFYDWKSRPEFEWLRDLVEVARPQGHPTLPTVDYTA